MIIPPVCDYCGKLAMLVSGNEIYPHRPDLKHLKFWYCNNDHPAAYVGCHKNSKNNVPLGRLADSDLRKAKRLAHDAFDPLWKDGLLGSRKDCYNWLAKKMGKDVSKTHIGMFDEWECYEVIDHCDKWYFPVKEDTDHE